jgi:hypothetical protein
VEVSLNLCRRTCPAAHLACPAHGRQSGTHEPDSPAFGGQAGVSLPDCPLSVSVY